VAAIIGSYLELIFFCILIADDVTIFSNNAYVVIVVA
jgi:hypothetical protein